MTSQQGSLVLKTHMSANTSGGFCHKYSYKCDRILTILTFVFFTVLSKCLDTAKKTRFDLNYYCQNKLFYL